MACVHERGCGHGLRALTEQRDRWGADRALPVRTTGGRVGSIFEPLSDRMLADPFAVYARLRAEDPVHRHEGLGAWVVTRHDDCTRVLKDSTTFGSDPRSLGIPLPDAVLSIHTLDPPEHAAVRHRFVDALRGQEVRGWADGVREAADELVGRVDGVVDFVTEVAKPLALRAVCSLYGVPAPDDEEPLRAASRTLVLGLDSGLAPERREPSLAAREALNGMIERWRPAARPGGVLTAVPPGGQVLRNSARAVFDAGYSTTADLLGNVVAWLTAGGPWRGDLAAVDGRAAEELIRLAGPVQVVSRRCKAEVDLRGRRLARGDVVIVALAAANRDPDVFPDPDTADFTRGPNPHLALGRGTHSCFGGHLGKQVLLALLHALGGVAGIEAAGVPVQRPTGTQRGLDRLPVRLLR
ncbi:MAG: cytochrome P450 [Saccharothrix sp.]|nr:cytochrome P450 [Saccharothrix sp.]